jgi:hypothetical protein
VRAFLRLLRPGVPFMESDLAAGRKRIAIGRGWPMGWFKKLLGRQGTHEEWLSAHPGKEGSKSGPPSISSQDEAQTRSTMERELDAQREKRQQS